MNKDSILGALTEIVQRIKAAREEMGKHKVLTPKKQSELDKFSVFLYETVYLIADCCKKIDKAHKKMMELSK